MKYCATALLLTSFAWSASAVTIFDPIYVDFRSQLGTGQPRSDTLGGVTYNLFGSESHDLDNFVASALDENGNATGVSMLITDDHAPYNGPSVGGSTTSGFMTSATIFNSVATDSVMWNQAVGGAPFTIGNLDATGGTLYEISVLSSRDGTGDRNMDVLINGVLAGTVNASDNTTLVTASNLTADLSGNLVVTFVPRTSSDTPVGNGFAYFNALRLTAVPEPSSMLLAGLGGLLMLKRRR